MQRESLITETLPARFRIKHSYKSKTIINHLQINIQTFQTISNHFKPFQTISNHLKQF